MQLCWGGVVYAGDSKITVTIAGEVELDLTATTAEGKFGTSTPATVSVSSDHFTGYTLSIKGDNAEGNLRGNTANLSSITNTAGISQETFANSVEYNGSWGFLPSKINSTDNTKYLPGPKNNSLIIDATKVANAEGVVNEYTLAIGARANMYTAIDSYANTFVITVTGNPPAYKINYEKNTAANVSNMPTTDIGQIGVMAANPTISRTTPTRTDGYRFVGWCDGGGGH